MMSGLSCEVSCLRLCSLTVGCDGDLQESCGLFAIPVRGILFHKGEHVEKTRTQIAEYETNAELFYELFKNVTRNINSDVDTTCAAVASRWKIHLGL